MSLGRLGINNIRNIKHAALELTSRINLFVGANGSGKTSLLEAVYFLGSGRTFRNGSVDPLISHGEADCTVFGVTHGTGGAKTNLGVKRDRKGGREIKINGAIAARASLLARCLPTLVLGPNTVELLTGPPGNRRKFLNWGVFHVEPSFGEVWEQASRCLRQRNQLLRKPGVGSGEFDAWNEQLGQLAGQIDEQRRRWFAAFEAAFVATSAALTGLQGVTCSYRRGWEDDGELALLLRQQLASDLQRGYTQFGHHRAELDVRVGKEPAVSVCSRGELKILAWAMVLGQGKVFAEQVDADLVYLVDDLASELDASHRRRVCDFLAASKGQVLATAIDRNQLEGSWGGLQPTVFHVEHGSFSVEETVNERR